MEKAFFGNYARKPSSSLLLLKYNLLIGLAHGARKVPLNGHDLAVLRERPTIFGGEIGSVKGSLGLDRKIVAIPFHSAFKYVAANAVSGFLAIGRVGRIIVHLAHLAALSYVDLQIWILVSNLIGPAIGRRHGPEIALGHVHFPSPTEIRLGLG